MKVLVTGGLGFTGRVVVQLLLEDGHDVVALTSRPGARSPVGEGRLLHVAHQDLRDRRGVARLIAEVHPEAVCHLAARTRIRESLADPVGYYDVNVTGTAHLLAALAEASRRTTAPPPRLVFASTGAVYGPREGALGEDEPTAPTNPYGASKLAAEQLIGYQAMTGQLAAVSLRCFNISGAVDEPDRDTTRIIPKALAVAAGLAERVQVNGDGSALREYTHVRDVAQAYLLALRVATPGQHLILNAASGEGASVAEVIDTARQVTGRAVPVEHLPPKPEPRVMVADSSRIRSLGWEPRHSDLTTIVGDSWHALAVPAAS